MKKYLTLLFLFCCLTSFAQERKKVGIVLSGGGAKGVAHIGALKIIEKAGIPIDYIAGTSMGSIIGGLYSIGYTPEQLDSMVRKQDWNFLLSDKIKRSEQSFTQKENNDKYVLSLPFKEKPAELLFGGVIKGQNLANLFLQLTPGYHDSINFNKLPIPFACVSENVVNGDEIVFHSGKLTEAMRASMAIPAVFTPVRLNGMVLVDGGLTNNFPVNIGREMGADLIIGVDVQNSLKTADELNSVTDILGQIIDLTTLTNYEKNVENTNVYIKVDVEGYSAASFTQPALDTLMQRGKIAAEKKYTDLLDLKKMIGIPQDYIPPKHGPFVSKAPKDTLYIGNITFTDMDKSNARWLLRKSGLRKNSENTMAGIQNALSILYGTQAYSEISYKLTDIQDGHDLQFLLKEKRQNTFNLGVRFDSEEIAAVLLNATIQLKTHIPSSASATGRLGFRTGIRLDYTVQPWLMKNFNFSYLFEYNQIRVNSIGSKSFSTNYRHHQAEISYSEIWYRSLKLNAGLHYEHYNFTDMLFNKAGNETNFKPEGFINYFIKLHYNTLNKRSFSTKGTSLYANTTLYTDNGLRYKGEGPFSAIGASWLSVFSITNRFAMIPSVYGRVIFGDNIPFPYQNSLGGEVYGHYMPQQFPFTGLNYIEIVDNSVMGIRLKLRERIGKKNYITLSGNYALTDNKFTELLSGNDIFGTGIGYGYDSLFGPLEIMFNWSNRSNKLGVYVNLGFTF